jgi:DNA-binding NtrC family response regulator
MAQIQPFVQVMIFGLDGELASELLDAVGRLGIPVDRQAFRDARECQTAVPHSGADVIFCSADRDRVRGLRSTNPRAFIIAASRLPDVSDWLDAIEAGANDYCASPFEPSQVRWILESSLRHHAAAA